MLVVCKDSVAKEQWAGEGDVEESLCYRFSTNLMYKIVKDNCKAKESPGSVGEMLPCSLYCIFPFASVGVEIVDPLGYALLCNGTIVKLLSRKRPQIMFYEI